MIPCVHDGIDTAGVESGGVTKNASVAVIGAVDGTGSGSNVCVGSTICGSNETSCSVVVSGGCFEIMTGSVGAGDSASIRIGDSLCNCWSGSVSGCGALSCEVAVLTG